MGLKGKKVKDSLASAAAQARASDTGAGAIEAVNQKAAETEKQMDALMLKAQGLKVSRFDAQEALEATSGNVGAAFNRLKRLDAEKAAETAARVGDGMAGPKLILANAQCSSDPLHDLMKGDIVTLPEVYSDYATWARNLEATFKRPDVDELAHILDGLEPLEPVYTGEVVIPKIDLLENTSTVPRSDGHLPYNEKGPIKGLLDLLETHADDTSNAKMRIIEENRARLPQRLSRRQAEAILRHFDNALRRKTVLHAIRDRVDDDAWADELADATTERVRELCGDPVP